MRKWFLFIIAVMAMAGCTNLPVQPTAQQEFMLRVCWWFGGKKYCPPADGSPLVLPCDFPNAIYERPIPVLPKPPVVPTAEVVGVIAPTDAAGRPVGAAEVCGQYGCTGVRTPARIVQYPAYQPPIAWHVQEPAKACAKVNIWGNTVGAGPWGLPSGPRLRHK